MSSRGPNAMCEGGYSIGEPCYCPVCTEAEAESTKRSPMKTPHERALASPGSLRRAVDAHCYQCMGEGQDPGTWERVRTCHIEKCALHHVRRKS